jgi:hypothetical protein
MARRPALTTSDDVEHAREGTPCPDLDRASRQEKLWWHHLLSVRADLERARDDHGHTAVSTLHGKVIEARLEYEKARLTRIAEEERIGNSTDAVERIKTWFARLPPPLRSRILEELIAAEPK